MDGTDIPEPQNFRSAETGCDYVELEWEPAKTALPVVYQVMMKKAEEDDDEWTECYKGTETRCTCTKLQNSTEYNFELYPIYDGVKGTNFAACFATTVRSLDTFSSLFIFMHYRWYT